MGVGKTRCIARFLYDSTAFLLRITIILRSAAEVISNLDGAVKEAVVLSDGVEQTFGAVPRHAGPRVPDVGVNHATAAVQLHRRSTVHGAWRSTRGDGRPGHGVGRATAADHQCGAAAVYLVAGRHPWLSTASVHCLRHSTHHSVFTYNVIVSLHGPDYPSKQPSDVDRATMYKTHAFDTKKNSRHTSNHVVYHVTDCRPIRHLCFQRRWFSLGLELITWLIHTSIGCKLNSQRNVQNAANISTPNTQHLVGFISVDLVTKFNISNAVSLDYALNDVAYIVHAMSAALSLYHRTA